MSTGYYKAIGSDGYVHLRHTVSRTYTHAVVTPRGWSNWCGRLDLARKALNQRGASGAEIVEAVEITAQEYRALYKAKQPERDAFKAAREASKAQWRAKYEADLAEHKRQQFVAQAIAKEPADRTAAEQAAITWAMANDAQR